MKTNNIKTRIAEYFFLNPSAKLRVRQIERIVRVPLPSAIRYTKELEGEGILKSSNIGNVKLYSADRISKAFLLQKRLFNLSSLYSSGLINFLIEELSNPTIVLFGSYSRGEDIENSDIDLYIETPSKKKINFKKFEKGLQRRIQFFKYKNIHEVKNEHMANNILNGVVLNGFIEVFK